MVIENIIFDLGNVLLTFKPEIFLKQFTNDPSEIDFFISNITRSSTWLSLDRGISSVDDAKKIFISRFPEKKELISWFFENWFSIFAPIEDNVNLLVKLKKADLKLYILSNFIEEAYNYVEEKFDFFSLFDGAIISSKEKVIKPEKEIYMILINRYNLIPEKSVFIDDILPFLRPAKKLGMKTIWYKSDINLNESLKKLGVSF
ncbi:MAG: HAD family hydrolase [Promethearchaeota archaeon]